MSSPPPADRGGRKIDPLFVFMLVAVVLAVSSSFILRLAVGSGSAMGPNRARAADPSDITESPPPSMAPAPRRPAAPPESKNQ